MCVVEEVLKILEERVSVTFLYSVILVDFMLT